MGSEKPKQFLMLNDKPIIVHSVNRLVDSTNIDEVLVLVPADWVSYTEELIKEYSGNTAKSITVLEGGAVRNDTIMNAIDYIEREGNLDDETIIVTHDAVRPFINDRIIKENIEAVQKCGAATTVIAATDTIVRSIDGTLIDIVPNRSEMYHVQTPQSFRAKELRSIYRELSDEEKAVLTDATRIYVLKGKPVQLVEGERNNIKITYPQDMAMAETIINSW